MFLISKKHTTSSFIYTQTHAHELHTITNYPHKSAVLRVSAINCHSQEDGNMKHTQHFPTQDTSINGTGT